MSFARQVLLSLRLIKLRRFLGSLFYPLQRDCLERRLGPQEQTLEATEETGAILRAEPTARGARFFFKAIELEAPLNQIPLLVKADSILPMEAEGPLALHLYPPPPGASYEGRVYSYAGNDYGDWRLDWFHLTWHQEQLQLTWQQRGSYPFPYRKLQLHLHGIELRQAWVDGQEILCQGNAIEVDRFEQIDVQGVMT